MARVRSLWQNIKHIMFQIQTEEGVYSANRVMPIWILILFTILFIIITILIFINKIIITQYNDLGMVYLGVLVACGTWLQGHHLTNSIYNTPPGSNGKPNNLINTVNNMTAKIQDTVNSKEKK